MVWYDAAFIGLERLGLCHISHRQQQEKEYFRNNVFHVVLVLMVSFVTRKYKH